MLMPTVVVVDDEEAMLRVFRRMLEGNGYRVLCFGTPQEALDAMAQIKVDVIICDQALPGITGLDLLRQAREAQPRAARLLMSGYVEHGLVAEALASRDIAGVIHKPFDAGRVAAMIARALGAGAATDD